MPAKEAPLKFEHLGIQRTFRTKPQLLNYMFSVTGTPEVKQGDKPDWHTYYGPYLAGVQEMAYRTFDDPRKFPYMYHLGVLNPNSASSSFFIVSSTPTFDQNSEDGTNTLLRKEGIDALESVGIHNPRNDKNVPYKNFGNCAETELFRLIKYVVRFCRPIYRMTLTDVFPPGSRIIPV